MQTNMTRHFTVNLCPVGYIIQFHAMASPCEIIIESNDLELANTIAQLVTTETWRIEDKYSRYQKSSVCSQINKSNNSPIDIDKETFELLKFAEQCYQLSDGLFDITSGVLGKAWHFDGSGNIPTSTQVNQLLPFVGWDKVSYHEKSITLPESMEIDFGGLGKEYAVDKVCQLIRQHTNSSVLVNFGGDIAVTTPRKNNTPWTVGIDLQGIEQNKKVSISFTQGAIATSGDANRYLENNGKRYSHILNPQTGWPIEHSASSITVASSSCLNAGIMSTLAMLQGKEAEEFLTENEVKHWCFRE